MIPSDGFKTSGAEAIMTRGHRKPLQTSRGPEKLRDAYNGPDSPAAENAQRTLANLLEPTLSGQ